MRQVLVGLALLVVVVPAGAAPGDPRSLQGVLEWPANLGNERFLVMRADDGGQYVIDLAETQRLSPVSVRAGERMSVAGYEGARAWQIEAYALAPGNTLPASPPPQRRGTPGVSPAPPAGAPSAAAPGAAAPAPAASRAPLERIHGRVVSTSGTTVVLRSDDGERHNIDLSPLTSQQRLRPGQEVTIFGRRTDGHIGAVGLVQVQEGSVAAPGRER